MNDRYIEALKKLKENLDDLKIDFTAKIKRKYCLIQIDSRSKSIREGKD